MADYTVRKALDEEWETVRDFYWDLIDRMKSLEYSPKWTKGIYPTDDDIKNAVLSGQMYIVLNNEKIIGAEVLNHAQVDGYSDAPWTADAVCDEATVIHLLGVMPEFSRRGVGTLLVNEAKRIAKENHQKALRLDVIDGNLPAERLYRKCGFSFVRRVRLFYEDTGWCDFDLYEYNL